MSDTKDNKQSYEDLTDMVNTLQGEVAQLKEENKNLPVLTQKITEFDETNAIQLKGLQEDYHKQAVIVKEQMGEISILLYKDL